MSREMVYYLSGKKSDCQDEGNLALSTSKVIELVPELQCAKTMNKMERDLRAYYKALRKHLHCPKKHKEQFLQNVKLSVDGLRGEMPGMVYADVIEYLGNPKDLAHALLGELPPSVIAAYKKRMRRIRNAVIGCVVAVAVILSCLTYYALTLKSNVHITEEKIITIYEN